MFQAGVHPTADLPNCGYEPVAYALGLGRSAIPEPDLPEARFESKAALKDHDIWLLSEE